MKKLISIFMIVLVVAMLSSCIKIYIPENKGTDTNESIQDNSQPTEDNTQQKEEITISHKSIDKDIYQSYDLGNYSGNGFDSKVASIGIAKYEIIQDYEEASEDTDYGVHLDKAIFDDHYILAIYFPNDRDKMGIVGLKSLRSGTGGEFVTVLNNGSGVIPSKSYYYYKVPKVELSDWYGQGTIQLRRETVPYTRTNQLSVSNDFMNKDGELLLLSRQELKEYISEKELPIRFEEIQNEKSYIVCFSKRRFDNILKFTKPEINEGVVTLSRDYDVSVYRADRAFLDIIPLNIEDKSTISKIELTSEYINSEELPVNDYQIANTAQTYKNVSFYKTFRGGVYYGTELADKTTSSYTIIENYCELLNKAEFYIDEEIFKDNYILVLKLVGENPQRLGFANAIVSEMNDTKEASNINSIDIDLYITPYYKQVLDDSKEDLVEILEESHKNKVEYEYIVVPKSHLNNVKKTGELDVNTISTFDSYSEPYIVKKSFNNEDYSIVSGNTWYITTNLELQDFNRKFGTSFNKYVGKKYNKEYIIVYLEDSDQYEIVQSTSKESDSLYYINYLVKKNEGEEKEKQGVFLCIEKNASSKVEKLIIERTIIKIGDSYPSYSTESDISSYDFYSMDLYYTKRPDWQYKVITDYSQYEEIFNTHKHYEIDDNITADMIFDESTLENNYILALYKVEGGSGMIKKGFYNARLGGNGILYMYSFESSRESDCAEHNELYFISIPKSKISKEIKGVKIEVTNEIVYNGPFENVIIASTKKDDVQLEKSHIIISSYSELESVINSYREYEKLQNIDFENYFALAFNRHYYTTAEYLYGEFVNFKVSVYGTASITFMSENNNWISDGTRTYILDVVIIPKEYLRYNINYFYIRYEDYSEPFELDGEERINDYYDKLEDLNTIEQQKTDAIFSHLFLC